MQKLAKLIIKAEKEKKLCHNRNSWLYTGAVKLSETNQEGEIIEIFTESGKRCGYGFFFGGENIAAYIFLFTEKKTNVLNPEFWEHLILKAYHIRTKILPPNTNIFRLIHSEGDQIPGLTIDIYKNTAVIEFKILGLEKIANYIFSALKKIGFNNIFIKKSISGKLDKQWISGDRTNPIIGKEYDINFIIDIENGQKTGFFIDQRENRKLIEQYSADKKMLNLFSYTGGFSIYALKAGANIVHSVDISKKALELAEKNAALNGFNKFQHITIEENAFDFLTKMPENYYDLIVIDPPAFSKNDYSVKNAIRGYKELNRQAIKKIKSEGIIFTFSCSQKIDKQTFRQIIFYAAADARRNVRIIHQLNQAPDHPIDIYQPKSEYLKGFVLLID